MGRLDKAMAESVPVVPRPIVRRISRRYIAGDTLHEGHENVGAVIQAYMRRSLEDVCRLVEAGVTVRLCKGIYDEPRRIAYKDFDTVRQNYIFLLEELFRGGVYVGIATH